MKSMSGDDGSYTLTVSFELGTNPDINTVNVNNRVQVALSNLPPEVQRQGVTVKKKSSALLGVIAVYSPKHTHDPLFLSNYVTINLLDRIKSTPGVGDATLWGPQDYAMRAWVRTDRLTGLGLTTGDIINAIQSQNVQAAVGRIGARPISDDQQLQLNIQTKGRLSTVEEFENIVIRTNPDGSVLRLGDVARIELGAANLDRDTRLNGGPAAAIAIYQAPGANAITHAQGRARIEIAEVEKRFPEDLAWKITYDPTVFVTDTIHEVQKTLIEAFILVVIVVFLFLGSVRATLIPTLAVPVSLIGTFIALLAVGYSANTVSLLAVVLAIGIVVDDAIVVVENVERVMEEHPELSPAEATKRAMAEITAPIIAITLVLAVGVRAGRLHSRHLRRTVPAIRRHRRGLDVPVGDQRADACRRRCAAFCCVRITARAAASWAMSCGRSTMSVTPMARPSRASSGFRSSGSRWWWSPWPALSAWPRSRRPVFFPRTTRAPCSSSCNCPAALRSREPRKWSSGPRRSCKEEEAVEDVTSVVGLNFIDNYSQPNAAFMVVTLKPFEERKDRSHSASALIARLGQKFRQIPGGTVVPLAPPPILGLGTGGGFTYVLEDLRGGDPKAMAQALRGLTVAANQNPQLSRVFSTFSATNPSIYLDIDRDKAQIIGVPLSAVFQALQASLGGYFVNNMNLFGRTWQVQVQAEAADRSSVDDIYRINVRSNEGKMIPLRSLAEVRVVVGPPALIRYNNLRAVTVQGSPGAGRFVGPGVAGDGRRRRQDAAARLCRRMDRYRVPGEARRRQDRDHSRLCGAVRLSVPRRHFTRAGPSRCRFCCRCRSALLGSFVAIVVAA